MSYWTYLTIDTGGDEPAYVYEAGNMTTNVVPIWYDALGIHLRDLEGKSGVELVPLLESAIVKLKDPANEPRYRALEPSNKWGSLESATQYLQQILDGCREHPKARLHISG